MYGSRAEADTFFALVDIAGTWATFSNIQKDAALELATHQIDQLPLQGEKYISTQSNQFPRKWYYQNTKQ